MTTAGWLTRFMNIGSMAHLMSVVVAKIPLLCQSSNHATVDKRLPGKRHVTIISL